MDKKIQFIVCGWWYDKFDSKENQTDFINQLIELNTENKSQSVKDIVSRKMPMAQTLRRQRYHGRPHRKLMLTTQE